MHISKGIPLWYFTLLNSKKRILRDQAAVDREALNNYPQIGHLTFLFDAYKAEFCKLHEVRRVAL
jgi:hypothetical protein